MKRLLAVLTVAALPVFAMPGGSQAMTADKSGSSAVSAKVKMVNFAFQPATITIQRGTKVVWRNASATTNHTSTSDTGVWDSGVVVPGGAFSRVFKVRGTFKYHCSIHPTVMKGTVKVQ